MVPENPSKNREDIDYSLVIISSLMAAFYVISNVMATKLVAIRGITISDAGTLTYPFVYMLGDVLAERWGYAMTKRIIWISLACNAITVLFLTLAVGLPVPSYQQRSAEAFRLLFEFMPRITLASFMGFIVGEFSNAWSLIQIRKLTKGRFLWMRTIGSSIIGFFLDTVLFVFLAFAGTAPWGDLWSMIWVQVCIKLGMEIFMSTPMAYGILHLLKKR